MWYNIGIMKNKLTLPILEEEVSVSDSVQEYLFLAEIRSMASMLKHKFKDTRSVSELSSLIVDELLDGRWDYRNYLRKRYLARLQLNSPTHVTAL